MEHDEIFREIRGNNGCEDCGDAEEQTAYRMGAYNFLKKPMDIDELLNSIRMAYRDKVENAMVAVSLAEGGDFDAAQDVLNEKDLLAEHKL